MAIMKCPECGNSIKENENTSQQTVVIQKKKSSILVWIVLIIIGIAFASATGILNNVQAPYNLDVTIDEGKVSSLGACYVKGRITNKNEYDDYTECTLTFNLVSDRTNEYIGKVFTKFSTIKANQTLNFEASGVCEYSVKEAKWKYEIKCGDIDK